MKRLINYILLFLCSWKAFAQEEPVYNLNIDNGLSANHVYCALVDEFGYLWLGTVDGVYRYNGYTLRKYDYNDGLPKTDVWRLYNDGYGRIWLLSIAQSIGYIKNNIYHSVAKHPSVSFNQIYPADLTCINDTFTFYNRSYFEGFHHSFGVIYNDTLFEKRLKTSFQDFNAFFIFKNYSVSALDNDIKVYNNNSLLDLTDSLPGDLLAEYKPKTAFRTQYGISSIQHKFANRYLCYSDREDSSINFYDLIKNEPYLFNLHDEKLSYHIPMGDTLTILTDKGVYLLDTNLALIDSYRYTNPVVNATNDGMNINFFSNNPIWGIIISTVDRGLFIRSRDNNSFRKNTGLPYSYQFINLKNDSVGYWWDEENNILAEVYKGEIYNRIKLPDSINRIKKIMPTKFGHLTISDFHLAWLDSSDKLLNKGYSKVDIFINPDSNLHYVYSVKAHKKYFNAVSDITPLDSNHFLLLGTGISGTSVLNIPDTGDTYYLVKADRQRFEKSVKDPITGNIISYASDKVMLFKDFRKKLLFQKDITALLGISSIDNICIDKYGHLFIKGADKLLRVSPITGSVKRMLNTYNLKSSLMQVNKDILTITGPVGILQYKILPDGKLQEVICLSNAKGLFYKRVIDAQVTEGHILLKTDNGFFNVNTEQNKKTSYDHNYSIILNIHDSLLKLRSNDTFKIGQDLTTIGIDVVKPSGTGALNISYSINGSALMSTGKQIVLSDLKAGSYNTVYVVANDNTWKSTPNIVTLYITPEWWQTRKARFIFFIGIILITITLIYVVITITRRIVNRNNERRNQQRELELKSIYSQINPHFIFNSLSTAQYFVRKNMNREASEHINQFSDLLRAYIKSSRNKYITITEETENLNNYLKLQLNRFENKFTYDIQVDEGLRNRNAKIPSLLLQPIVENSLNHGFFHKEETGHLLIQFKLQDQHTLVCIVDDNGIGRKRSKEMNTERMKKVSSYGTILIDELIHTFNKYEKINIKLQYIDKQLPDTGTTVIITINNYQNV